MKKLIAAGIGALMLAGCGSVRYPASYLLDLPAPPHNPAPLEPVLGAVAVRDFRCPEYLCEGRIVYRPTPEEVGFYEYHRWAMNPREAITQSMVSSLRAESIFKAVVVHEQRMHTAYVLTGNIERLEEVDQGRDVRGVCTISAQLIDARTGYVVWNETASGSVRVETRSVAGVVSSLSAAVQTAVDQLVASAATNLRGRGDLAEIGSR
jgi:ABC-type uncharacterized transport system auxiliary subunit